MIVARMAVEVQSTLTPIVDADAMMDALPRLPAQRGHVIPAGAGLPGQAFGVELGAIGFHPLGVLTGEIFVLVLAGLTGFPHTDLT